MASAGKNCCRSLCRLLLPILLMGPASAPADELYDFDLHMSRFPLVRKETHSDPQKPSLRPSDSLSRPYPSTGFPSALSSDRYPRTKSSGPLSSNGYPRTGVSASFPTMPTPSENTNRLYRHSPF